ncbi:MAG: hypothetical protein H6Q68_3754 [Firmicutes bacterium]|nr:hypothetical protein [Bacillota bacterium]
MDSILPAALGVLLSVVLVICLHFATIYIPALAPYKDYWALFCIFLGLSFATLATPWFNKREKAKKEQISESSVNIDFTIDSSGHPPSPTYGGGSGRGTGSTRNFNVENISPNTNLNNIAAISLTNTADINPSMDISQIAEAASNEIVSAVDLGQTIELGGELSEAIGEIVGTILE